MVSTKEDNNSRSGSKTTNNVVAEDSQTLRFRISSETYKKMLPDKNQKNVDWDQTRKEQGTWSAKLIVSMWFNNETNLLTMVGMLDTIKQDLTKAPFKLHGQKVSSGLEMSPKRKPFAKAHALFYRGLKDGRRRI